MPEKIRFTNELGIALFLTQLNSPESIALYKSELNCEVRHFPNCGIDPDLIFSTSAFDERPIDIGYRSMDAAWYLGHNERADIAEAFNVVAEKFNLKVDISLKHEDRLNFENWVSFLNRCKGQIGTEAGGDYFELTDKTRIDFFKYMEKFPDTSFTEIRERFFARYQNPISGRIISPRNIEAAATRTVQILFEGEYGGYLEPDVHYISLKKDFSNLEETIVKFRDQTTRERIVEEAYQLAISEFTFEKLSANLHQHIVSII